MKGSRARNTGFTLIEVLVTMIIMAIGLLGLAGLQLAAMKSNYSAYQRTQAVIAAYDLIDRFRIAPERIENACASTVDGDCVSAWASDVFDDWKDALLHGSLANNAVEGELDCRTTSNACGAGNCSITVRWDDSRPENIAGGATRAIKRNDDDAPDGDGLLEMTVCTRLPEDV